MRSLPVTATSLNRYMQTVRQQSSPVPPAQHRQAREEGRVQYARAVWNRNPRFTGEKTLLALYVTRASRAVAWLQRPSPKQTVVDILSTQCQRGDGGRFGEIREEKLDPTTHGRRPSTLLMGCKYRPSLSNT